MSTELRERKGGRALFCTLFVLAAAVLCLGVPARRASGQQDFYGQIQEGSLYKIPVEVRDWRYIEIPPRLFVSGESCEQVLAQDLKYSDFFDVMRETFSLPGQGDSLSAPRPPQALAEAEVRRRGDKVELEGKLTDAATGKAIFRKLYKLGDPPNRATVHAFSDDIVLYMTGERGVAATKIAYVGDATGHKEIYLVDYDGAAVDMATNLRSITLSPRWSPKGDRLAFTTFAHGTPELMGLNLRDGKLWSISARSGMNSAPCWHPGGDRLAASLSFEGNSEIYLLDVAGKQPRRITHEPSIDTSPSFDPSGDRIAFTSDRSGEPQVYVMDVDGTNLRRLSYVGKHGDSPDWSPKGDRICFVVLIDRVFDVCTVRPDGSDLRRLTGGGNNHENPRWAPDGRHLVYAMRQGGTRRLFVMAADGSGIRQLTWSRGEQYNPSWSPPMGSFGD